MAREHEAVSDFGEDVVGSSAKVFLCVNSKTCDFDRIRYIRSKLCETFFTPVVAKPFDVFTHLLEACLFTFPSFFASSLLARVRTLAVADTF